MNLRIAYRGSLQRTEQLDAHIQTQLAKLIKFLEQEHGPATVDMVLEGHPNHAHNSVHLHVIAPQFEAMGSREDGNIYAVIDKVIDIVYDELHKQKQRHVHDKKNRGPHRL